MSKRNLFVEYSDGPAGSHYEDFGEVFDLATVSDADLRAAVEEWLKPCPNRPCGGYVVKDEDGGYHLVDLYGDYEIRNAKTGAVLEQH